MVSVRSTPGTRGWPGKWPSKTGLASGTVETASIRFASRSRPVTRSIISKYSRRMRVLWCPAGRSAGRDPWRLAGIPDPRRDAGRAIRLRALGGHEGVDARHEVLQNEVLLSRNLALVDL